IFLNVKVGGKPIFLYFVDLITPGNVWLGENIERHVANSHSLFNIVNCLIFIPLTGVMAFIVTKIVKGEAEVIAHKTNHLDERMLVTPEIAIGQAKKEIVNMAKYSAEQLELAIDSIYVKKHRDLEQIFEKIKRREEVVNYLEKEIATFIIRIDQQSITEEQSRTTAGYLHLIHDLERIGDISENIMDLVNLKEEENTTFSEKADEEIRQLGHEVKDNIRLAIKAFDLWDRELSNTVIATEKKIDVIEQRYRDNHISRLSKGNCNPAAGVVFLDILSNLERAADHAENIAKKIIDINTF
ncbi:MAG: hypothetical protein KJ811_01205, partial [Candidatus Margulisbacteria bacterium]|nr:hypothetical protein [Candidatus Margulisiibacteriota bacterium]